MTHVWLVVQLILDEEFTQAEGKDWHLGHFCCYKCDTNLGGHKVRPRDMLSSLCNVSNMCLAVHNSAGQVVRPASLALQERRPHC